MSAHRLHSWTEPATDKKEMKLYSKMWPDTTVLWLYNQREQLIDSVNIEHKGIFRWSSSIVPNLENNLTNVQR